MSTPDHEASIRAVDLTRPEGLLTVPTTDLVQELLARLPTLDPAREMSRLLQQLSIRMESALSDQSNRFSPEFVQELLGTYFLWQQDHGTSVKDEVFLELGAGSETPLSTAAAMMLLGAKRGYALELTPPLSEEEQARSLGRLAYWLIARHDLFPKLKLGPLRATILERSQEFAVGELAAGKLQIPDALRLLVADARETGLADDSVHRVASTSFFEHVDSPDAVVEEIARITAPGGLSIHNVDAADHGMYWENPTSPISFLMEAPGETLVRGCNRLRIFEVVALFEKHGFALQERTDYAFHEWTSEELTARVAPYSSMPPEDLRPLRSVLVFRLA